MALMQCSTTMMHVLLQLLKKLFQLGNAAIYVGLDGLGHFLKSDGQLSREPGHIDLELL